MAFPNFNDWEQKQHKKTDLTTSEDSKSNKIILQNHYWLKLPLFHPNATFYFPSETKLHRGSLPFHWWSLWVVKGYLFAAQLFYHIYNNSSPSQNDEKMCEKDY